MSERSPLYSVGELVALRAEAEDYENNVFTVWRVEGFTIKNSVVNGKGNTSVIYTIKGVKTGTRRSSREEDLIFIYSDDKDIEYFLGVDLSEDEDDWRLVNREEVESHLNDIAELSDIVIRDMETGEIISELPSLQASIETKTVRVKLRLTQKEKDDRENELLDRYNDKLRFAKADGKRSAELQYQIDEIEDELRYLNEAIIIKKA